MLHNYLREVKQSFFWRRISQSEIRNLAAAESEGGQKFLPPNPLPFCPPERSVWRAERAVNSVQNRFGLCHIIAPFGSLPACRWAWRLLKARLEKREPILARISEMDERPAAHLRYRSGGNLAEKYPPLS